MVQFMKSIAREVDESRSPTITEIVQKVAEDRWVMNVWDWCRLVKKKLVSVNIHSITDFLRKSHKYNIEIGRKGQKCLEYVTMDSFLSIIAKYVVFKRETIQSYWEYVEAKNSSDEE